MMNYSYKSDGIKLDELSGGSEFATELWNVKVGSEVERGMLLASNSIDGEFSLVGSASDAEKILVIAAEDSASSIVSAYSAGKFNGDKIKLGGGSSLTIDNFIEPLRQSGIRITSAMNK